MLDVRNEIGGSIGGGRAIRHQHLATAKAVNGRGVGFAISGVSPKL
jgi:hypothetical protein